MQKFDVTDFHSCVARGVELIKNREAQTIAAGQEWNINMEACRWSIEQAILTLTSVRFYDSSRCHGIAHKEKANDNNVHVLHSARQSYS